MLPQRHGQNLYKQNIANLLTRVEVVLTDTIQMPYQEGNKFETEAVDFSIKMSDLLTHHIQVNNIGICMERTQLIDIVQNFLNERENSSTNH